MALRTAVAPGVTAAPVIVVLGVDTAIGLTVVRELGAAGLTVHGIGRSAGAIGGASRHCARLHVRPPGAPLDQWLPGVLQSIGADALLAVSEHDLVALAALPDRIGPCRILTPRAEPLALALDKQATLAVAQKVGITTPPSWQPQADSDWSNLPPGLDYPLIAKWADPNEVAAALAAAGLPLIKAERIDDATALAAFRARYEPLSRWPLVQGFAPGVGVGQMLHMADGRATLTFEHRRLHEWPPEGGVSTLCEAVPDDAVHAEQMALSEALLARIGWEGPAMVEYRFDPATGAFVLMEINGRFWGSLPLASAAGACFAREQIARAFPDVPLTPARPRRRARARFMIPETRRLLHILRHGGAEGRGAALAAYAGGFLDPAMHYYVWQWRDPAPMLRDMRNILTRG